MPYLIIPAALLLVVLGGYLFMIAPGKRRSVSPFDTTRFAHRGLHSGDAQVPENSLAAFRLAREAGYGVELDVQFTADRQVVVFHDATLKRMCGIDERVNDLTYEQLQSLTLLDSDQRIPLLTDVLDTLGNVPLVCEFKSHGRASDTSLCQAAAPLLATYKGPWCIESFNPFMVQWFRRHRPRVIRGILAKSYAKEDGLPLWQRWLLGSLASNVLCRPDFIAFQHSDHKSVGFRLCRYLFAPLCIAWTIRSEAQQEAAYAHFDAVIFEGYRPVGPAPARRQRKKISWMRLVAALCFVAVVGSALSIAVPRIIQDATEARRIHYGTPRVPNHFNEEMATEALGYINDARTTAGLKPLTVDNGALAKAAQTRAKELTVYFAHERPNGDSWETVFDQYSVWGSLRGENLASGQSTAAAVYNSWWHSQSHKENMMHSEYTHTSLVCLEYEGTCYWVQLFR